MMACTEWCNITSTPTQKPPPPPSCSILRKATPLWTWSCAGTKEEYSPPTSNMGRLPLLSRKQQVILMRLRTGHNRLNSHMHRKLKLASSPTCPCGPEDQTTEMVLQRCPLHKVIREDVWPVSTSLTTKLYGGKQDLEKTTSFISREVLIV